MAVQSILRKMNALSLSPSRRVSRLTDREELTQKCAQEALQAMNAGKVCLTKLAQMWSSAFVYKKEITSVSILTCVQSSKISYQTGPLEALKVIKQFSVAEFFFKPPLVNTPASLVNLFNAIACLEDTSHLFLQGTDLGFDPSNVDFLESMGCKKSKRDPKRLWIPDTMRKVVQGIWTKDERVI